jgi:hypothetical protein
VRKSAIYKFCLRKTPVRRKVKHVLANALDWHLQFTLLLGQINE